MKDVRQEYHAKALKLEDLNKDPLRQAEQWVQEAIDAELPLPNAMALATVDSKGQPSSRIVLLKGIEQGQFIFFSDYSSQKGQDLEQNNRVSFTMFWQAFDRQLIVKGKAKKLSRQESLSYFESRPYDSQLSAAVSQQSQVVDARELEQQRQALKEKYPKPPVPMPERWGGYAIEAHEIQFWHGRPNRFHDRFRYLKNNTNSWTIEQLSP